MAMAAGHYADAVTRFEECLAENPTNVQVRFATRAAASACWVWQPPD